MRAVLCSAFTGPEDLRIGEIEEPKPASDEMSTTMATELTDTMTVFSE